MSVATLPDSTTTVPYEVKIVDIPEDLRAKYDKDIAKAVAKQQIGWFMGQAGMGTVAFLDETTDENGGDEELSEYTHFILAQSGVIGDIVKIAEDYYVRYHQPEGNISVEFKVVRADRTVADSDFDIEVIDGDYTEEDGTIILTSDAIIKVVPKTSGVEASLSFESTEGEELCSLPVVTVDDHECSGEYTIIAPPTGSDPAVKAVFCDTCHKLIRSTFVKDGYTVMLSNGYTTNDIRGALEAAKDIEEDIKLYLFGTVNITTDITVPENITVIIVPHTVLNIKEGCVFNVRGELKNFSSDAMKKVKICLNYWNGRSEMLEVESGTVVDSLPDISTETCALKGWYKDEAHTVPFTSFTAGESCNYYEFYADIDHSFNSRGRCSKCHELENGRDAFIGISASVSDEITLRLTADLSASSAADSEAYGEFILPNGAVKIQKLSEAVNNGDGTYTFSCSLIPIYIDDEISLQIHYSDGAAGSVISYSVRKYLDALTGNKLVDEATAEYIDSLIVYAESLKAYNDDTISPEDIDVIDTDVALGDEYNVAVRREGDMVKASQVSMSVGEKLELTVKFRLTGGSSISDYVFTVGGETVSAVQDGDLASVTWKKLTPDTYGELRTFRAESVSDPGVYAETDFCPFTYAKLALNAGTDAKLINLMKALVIYGEKAANLNK